MARVVVLPRGIGSTLLVVVVISWWSLLGVAFGDSCVPMPASLASQCQVVIGVGTPVLVPDGLTINDLDNAAAADVGVFLVGLWSTQCTDAGVAFVCAQYFHSCAPVALPDGSSVSLPTSTCKAQCIEFVAACGSMLTAIGATKPDCANALNQAGLEEFPYDASIIVLAPGLEVRVSCTVYRVDDAMLQQVPRASCQAVDASSFPLSQCQAVVNYPVYVPDGSTISDLDQTASQLVGLSLLGLVGSQCTSSLMPLACSLVFRPCFFFPVAPGLQVLLAQPPCQQSCLNLADTCASESLVWELLPPSITSCDTIDPSTGLPQYPQTGLSISLSSSITVEVPCNQDALVITQPFEAIPRGTCEKLESPTTYSQCSRAINWNRVFVPEGSSQQQLDQSALNQTFQLLYLEVDEQCSAAALQFVCGGTFLGCETVRYDDLQTNVVIPRPPCKSVCERFNQKCSTVLEQNGIPPQDCSQLPDSYLTVEFGNYQGASVHCTENKQPIAVQRTCPPYTTPSEYEPGTCVIVCPTPFLSDHQVHIYTTVSAVFGHVGIACALLILLAYMTHPWKSSFPRSSAAWLQIPIIAAVVSQVIPVWVGWESAVCDKCGDPNNGYTWIGCWLSHWSWCWLGGWLLYWGAISGVVWYNLVAIGIFQSLSSLRFDLPRWLQITLFHIVGYVLPFILVAVVALNDDIQPTGGYEVCFVNTEKWDGWFPEALFWIPFASLLFSSAVLLGYVLFRIWWIMGVKGLYKHWRLAAFLAHGICSFTYVCLYQWIFDHGRMTSRANAITDWVLCRAANLDPSACAAQGDIPGAENFPADLADTVVICFVPIMFAVILLSDPEVALHWYDTFRRYVLRQRVPDRWADQKRALKLSKAVGSSSSLGGMPTLSASGSLPA